MRVHVEILGFKLVVETAGLHAAVIETNRHEFYWNRNEWFEGPNGEGRHWLLERKTGRLIRS